MHTVGFIGLGVMGRPMAANLVDAGYAVVVHNRSRPAVDELVARGATAADGPDGVAAAADVVFTCLPDSPDVEEVLLGQGGVLSAAAPGSLLVDTSTVRPETARLVAARAADAGVMAVDAPVSGGHRGAADGTLSIMAGGDAEAVAAARPFLEVLGTTIAHVGPAGAGQTVKAVNQLLVGGNLALVAEALVLLEACAVDMEPALRVLRGGFAGSAVLEHKTDGMLARSFTPGFRADLHLKDLGITLATARERGVALPATALVEQLYVGLHGAGRGDLDHTALLMLVEELSGRGERPA